MRRCRSLCSGGNQEPTPRHARAGEHRLSKKLKAMGKKSQFGRAANVSVEGRNVTL